MTASSQGPSLLHYPSGGQLPTCILGGVVTIHMHCVLKNTPLLCIHFDHLTDGGVMYLVCLISLCLYESVQKLYIMYTKLYLTGKRL